MRGFATRALALQEGRSRRSRRPPNEVFSLRPRCSGWHLGTAPKPELNLASPVAAPKKVALGIPVSASLDAVRPDGGPRRHRSTEV
jgi:hypothetical protein